MATKEYWAKRCAELEKYMELNKLRANMREYSTFGGCLAYAIRQKQNREKHINIVDGDLDIDTYHCSRCGGSGEGDFDGSVCAKCNGMGEYVRSIED